MEQVEVWDLYDENRNLTGKTIERGKEIPDGYFHLAVHVWIINSEGEFLISRRADSRPTYPGLYECVGGSVVAGEESRQGAIREAIEEVGVNLEDCHGEVVYSKIRAKEQNRKFQDIMDVWLFNYDGEADLKNATTDEVSEIKWLSIDEIKTLFDEGKLVPTLEYIFDVLEKLQKSSKNNKKCAKNKKNSKKLSEKSKYFDFYDDVKSSCHKIIDW